MKKLLIFLGTTLSTITIFAADDTNVRSALMEVQSAQSQTQILFNDVTTPQQKERVRYISQKLSQAEQYLQKSLNIPNNPPQPSGQVELFKSDSCNGDLVGIVGPATDCSRFSTTESVWGVRINGKCQDISDTNSQNACRIYQNAANPEAVKVYKSDSCRDSLVGIFSSYTNCETLEDSSGNSAWAIMVGEQCKDIADTSLKLSCRAFKAINSVQAVKFYKSDSCKDSLVAAVDYQTNCANFAGLPQVWAIETNGKCQDITDLDAVSACQRFKP